MDLHRIRVQLRDTPGQLARVAGALGDLGVNILEVDLHSVVGAARADEMLVDLTRPLDLRAVELAVLKAGAEVLDIAPADPHELKDPVTRALELAYGFLRESDHSALADLAAALVRADQGAIVPASGLDPVAAASARVGGGGRQSRERADDDTLEWTLSIPFHDGHEHLVLTLSRRQPHFSFTEMARVRALLGLVPRTAPSAQPPVALPDGGAIETRLLSPNDLRAAERLHDRCSATTLAQRYFTSVPLARSGLLPRLFMFDEHHLAIGAATGSELVGIAHLAIEREQPRAEIAILVEDTHQRRGIATALLAEATSHLLDRGIEHLEALTLPGNGGMETLVQRLGQPLRLRREAGLVRVVIDLRQLAEQATTARR